MIVGKRRLDMKIQYFYDDEGDKDHWYRRIAGGIGWEGKRPGFVVIVGEDLNTDGAGRHHCHILKGAEGKNTEELLAKCFFLNEYFKVKPWVGDTENKVEMDFVDKVNKGYPEEKKLRIFKAPFSDDTKSFIYCLKTIQNHLDPHKILHFGEESKIQKDMQEITPENREALSTGDYPAIAALGYVLGHLSSYGPQTFSGDIEAEGGDWDIFNME